MFVRCLNKFQRNLLLDQKNDDGASGGGAGGSGGTGDNKVAFDTYQKVLDEKKAEQRKREELESQFGELKKKVDDAEAEKLKAQGDKDALIKSLEEKLKTSESKFETESTKFKLQKVTSAFREHAVKEGCQNIDDLQKLFSDKFKEVKVNPNNFDVDEESVKQIIAQAKEKSAYLFQPKKMNVHDVNLGGDGNKESYLEELKKCKTQKELDAVRKKHGRA